MKKRTTGWIAGLMTLAVAAVYVAAAEKSSADAKDVQLATNDVVWTSHSNVARDSMPVGNGDIGINVWTEENGDLLVYLGKTDAFDAQGRLLKLGRLRIHYSGYSFTQGKPFRQQLHLQDGSIRIKTGDGKEALEMTLWVDANRPVVNIDTKSEMPFLQSVTLELWRREKKSLLVFGKRDDNSHGVDGLSATEPPMDYPDTVPPLSPERKDQIVWFHRNTVSVYPVSVKCQGLDPLPSGVPADPLINRTFGAVVQGPGFVSDGPVSLLTAKAQKETRLSVVPLTRQTATEDDWLNAVEELRNKVLAIPESEAFVRHEAWWSDFWKRSDVEVSGGNAKDTADITRGWHLNRFVTACTARGNAPAKFNGGIFNVDGINSKGEPAPRCNADARAWGPGYWNQNERHLYWPMLEAGDYEQLRPFFKMYLDALPMAQHRVKTYYGHAGAQYPETMYFWGTYLTDGDLGYGWQRKNNESGGCYRGSWPAKDPSLGDNRLAPGITQNPYIRYHWQGGIEMVALMLRYYDHTQDAAFARETLLPFSAEIVKFYDLHYKRDARGKIRFDPAMALESFHGAVNPTPEIAGLRFCLGKMLTLPTEFTNDAQRKEWRRLLSELPELPTITRDGKTLIASAEILMGGRANHENVNLYALWPYLQAGVLGGDLKLAQDSYAAREVRGFFSCWHTDNLFAAYAGLAKEASWMLPYRFVESGPCRFPTFYVNGDWVPDLDNGGVCQNTIQSMLMQCEGDKIVLLPAWPKEWNAAFKLHAPKNTTVECRVTGGQVAELKVTPESRRRDVKVSEPFTLVDNRSAADLQALQLNQMDRSQTGPHNPHPDAQWFPGAGLGLFIHWGLASIHGDGDLSWAMLANKPWVDGTVTPNVYWGLTNGWKADQMDYDKMLGAAKAAGFTYAVMVTKHHDGFTFWPSAFGDVGTAKTFGGRDFVKEYVDACRKYGLKVGLYYSPPDWRFDRLYRSFSWAGPALGLDHQSVTLPPKPAGHDEARRKQVQGQVHELLTRYGKIDLIWFDGGQGEISNAEVRKLQPGIVINMRNGRGDYGDSESSLPGKRFNGWFESCLPCWPKRMWSYSYKNGCYDSPTTLTMLVLLRAWGGNLLANVGPKGDGSLAEGTLSCWSEMAQWMSHSRESVVGTRAGPWPEKVNQPVTLGAGVAYIHFLPKLSEKVTSIPPEVKDWTSMRKIIPAFPWDHYSTTAIWKDVPAPVKVTLLRTGETIPYSYVDNTLTLGVPEHLRTSSVDVVKVRFARGETTK